MADALLRPVHGRKKSNTRRPYQEVLIFCNGEESEKNYLESLCADKRLPAAKVRVIASAHNRLSLVKGVEKYLKKNSVDKDVTVWVVFDVDAKPKGEMNVDAIKRQVDEAQELCEKKKFRHAISNDSFEYWLLLHFQYCDAHLHRDILMQKLSECLGKKYDKREDIYEDIKDKTASAKKHATRIAGNYSPRPLISRCGPYTGMHNLLDFIEKIGR